MKRILKLIKAKPDWEWNSLDNQGFYEIMQQYHHAPFQNQKAVTKSFELVQEYIEWYAQEAIKWAVKNKKV